MRLRVLTVRGELRVPLDLGLYSSSSESDSMAGGGEGDADALIDDPSASSVGYEYESPPVVC